MFDGGMFGFGDAFDCYIMENDAEIEQVVDGIIACYRATGEIPEITAEEIYSAYGYSFSVSDIDEVCVRVRGRL